MAAHRGGLSLYPESTMKGFTAVAKDYPDAILEMDVRQLADGTLAIFHDTTVDRIAMQTRGPVAKMTPEQWRKVRIKDPHGGSPERPVLLQEILDEFGHSPRVLMIERKGKTSVDDFLKALDPFRDQVIVQDFNAKNVQRMTNAGFDALQLTSDPHVKIVEGVYAVGVSSAAINEELCQRAHALDVRVWAWGDDVVYRDPALAKMGVDGFIVNDPRR